MVILAAREAWTMKASLMQGLDQEQISSQGSPLLAQRASAHFIFLLASTLLQLFLFSRNKGSSSKGSGSQLTPVPAYRNSLHLHPATGFLLALFNFSFLLFSFFLISHKHFKILHFGLATTRGTPACEEYSTANSEET